MEIRNYRATLQADNGKHVLLVSASSEEMAYHILEEAEKCPRRAIIEMVEITDCKLVDYACATSETATKAGYGTTGCWFVALYELKGYKRKKILKYFLDKTAATLYADSLLYPYHWMHHYLLEIEKKRTQTDAISKH